ncbi:hypothetical protein BVC80_1395g128 [Macleaya cordata]|uniref:Uncharacterized protein n=1 Tax=Macleaya cordata TaxID=56857 RepID=A0A200Q1S1_MACCD|nr:hypothetical protein BVC80_1395g128 [Macleaya cordata]
MLAKESGTGSNFDLPEEIISVLPSDPFEQLDIARKITSIALSTRVSKLESESSRLQAKIEEKDDLISELQSQIESLDAALSETTDRLTRADQEKENLLKENDSLSNTVKKLNRDVSKLEIFKKTLMQSLQEDDENAKGPTQVAAKQIQGSSSFSPGSIHGEEDATLLPPSKTSSMRSQISETENSFSEDGGSVEMDASRYGTSQGPLLVSYNSTPRLTPPGSPPSFSAAASPRITSKPVSPRRHSISFPSTRGMFDDRSSLYSSMPPSYQSSISSSPEMGSQTGRTRVDGKEFFRQVRYIQSISLNRGKKKKNLHIED